MPSPRNSNYEKLFMPRRLALDVSPSTPLGDLQLFLQEKLTNPDDLRTVETLINRLLEANPDDSDPDEQAQDKRRRGVTGDHRIQRRAWLGGDSGRVASDLAKRFPLAKMPRQLG